MLSRWKAVAVTMIVAAAAGSMAPVLRVERNIKHVHRYLYCNTDCAKCRNQGRPREPRITKNRSSTSLIRRMQLKMRLPRETLMLPLGKKLLLLGRLEMGIRGGKGL